MVPLVLFQQSSGKYIAGTLKVPLFISNQRHTNGQCLGSYHIQVIKLLDSEFSLSFSLLPAFP